MHHSGEREGVSESLLFLGYFRRGHAVSSASLNVYTGTVQVYWYLLLVIVCYVTLLYVTPNLNYERERAGEKYVHLRWDGKNENKRNRYMCNGARDKSRAYFLTVLSSWHCTTSRFSNPTRVLACCSSSATRSRLDNWSSGQSGQELRGSGEGGGGGEGG